MDSKCSQLRRQIGEVEGWLAKINPFRTQAAHKRPPLITRRVSRKVNLMAARSLLFISICEDTGNLRLIEGTLGIFRIYPSITNRRKRKRLEKRLEDGGVFFRDANILQYYLACWYWETKQHCLQKRTGYRGVRFQNSRIEILALHGFNSSCEAVSVDMAKITDYYNLLKIICYLKYLHAPRYAQETFLVVSQSWETLFRSLVTRPNARTKLAEDAWNSCAHGHRFMLAYVTTGRTARRMCVTRSTGINLWNGITGSRCQRNFCPS